jgi:hypothetical protein
MLSRSVRQAAVAAKQASVNVEAQRSMATLREIEQR